jgi:uncharacterized membrane protein YkoI
MISPAGSAADKEGRLKTMAAGLFVMAAVATTAFASNADLKKEAKISLETARAAALKGVPGGKIQSEELEKENGKLIYSFDIETRHSDVVEVHISAISGKVVSVRHESPAEREAEQKSESKEKKH